MPGFDFARFSQALADMRRQIDEIGAAVAPLVQRRQGLVDELAAIDEQLARIAGPLVGVMDGQPAPAPPAPPAPPASVIAPFLMGAPAGTLQPPPSFQARPGPEELRDKVLQALPPTTEEPIGWPELRRRLRSRGVPLDESARKRLSRLVKDLVAANLVVPQGPEGPERRFQRNSSSPVVEAAAFTGPPSGENRSAHVTLTEGDE